MKTWWSHPGVPGFVEGGPTLKSEPHGRRFSELEFWVVQIGWTLVVLAIGFYIGWRQGMTSERLRIEHHQNAHP